MMYIADKYTTMQITKRVKKQSKVDPTQYVDRDNGTNMAEKCNENVSISLKEDTGQFTVDTDNYIVFDADAMEYVQNAVAKADIGRVFKLSGMIRTDCSVLYQNNNHPHNANTLPTVLDMSQDKFYTMVRRLVSKGILAYAVCAPSGYTQKIYMLNPYIARRRKTFNNELLVLFRDVTKPIPVKESRKGHINTENSNPEQS